MLPRPSTCADCQLHPQAEGFSQPDGPPSAPVAFWGEALGEVEAKTGRPFVGPAGRLLDRLLTRLGKPRELHRVHNIVSCHPPGDYLVGAPWEKSAIYNCQVNRLPVLQERSRVHVTLGATAAKVLLNYPPKFNVRSFHGCPFRTEHGWVVPTFHPSFLLQGGAHFTNVVLFDISRALEIAESGDWQPQEHTTIVDPAADWFQAWCDQIPPGTWVFPDIETAGKIARESKMQDKEDEEEDITPEDTFQPIIRIGFSVHPDEGVSVPWCEPYIAMVKKLLARTDLEFWYQNWRYDVPVLETAGAKHGSPIWEIMDAWGALQPRLPRMIAFVAPFFSTMGPWKHLSATDLGDYNARDCIQQHRATRGIVAALQRENRWEPFYRHRHLMDIRALVPAEKVGLHVDRIELIAFGEKLGKAAAELQESFKSLTDIGHVTIAKRPKDTTGYTEEEIEQVVRCCDACGAIDVASAKHRCKDKALTPAVVERAALVKRWVKREAFNPDSRPEMLKYIESIGEKPGRNKKTKSASVGKAIVDDIAKRTKDPLLKAALQYKAITKVKGTYADGLLKRLQADERVHATTSHIPWTWRLSMLNPNLQNVVNKEEEEDKPESGFKRVVTASPGCLIVEADKAGVEAMLSGYFMGDPDYIRLAMLGMHSYVLSHGMGEPASPSWPDSKLKAHLEYVKEKYYQHYRAYKAGVFARNYVGSAFAIKAANPATFPTLASAQKVVDLYDSLTPKRVAWWQSLWDQAHRQNYLENPYRYRAYFWEVYTWDSRTKSTKLGPDARRAVNFKPQSVGYGVLAEDVLELWDPDSPHYVGYMYHDQTPLRALIHDSILSEVEESYLDEYCRRVQAVMTRPVPVLPLPWDPSKNLQIGVSIKVGKNWGEMEEWRA